MSSKLFKQMKKPVLINCLFLVFFCQAPYSLVNAEVVNPKDFRQGAVASSSNTCTGDTYYVSNSGKNTANGLSSGTAWATVSKVNSSRFSPGDCILFKRGDTWREQLVVPSSGTASKYITFGAYGSGDKPLFDGKTFTLVRTVDKFEGFIHIKAKNYIIVENLRIQNVGDISNLPTSTDGRDNTQKGSAFTGNENSGINMASASYITVRNCETYRTEGHGIRSHNSNNIIIDGNEVELANIRSNSECITISNSHHVEVMYNKVHNNGNFGPPNGGTGIDSKGGSNNIKIHHNEVTNLHQTNGIYADAFSKITPNIEIYNNYVHDTQGTGISIGSEAGGTLSNVFIHHNIVHNALRGGMFFHDKHPANGPDGTVRDIYVYNNTFYNNGTPGTQFYGNMRVYDHTLENLVIKNNILAQNHNFHVGIHNNTGPAASKYTVDTNLIHGSQGSVGGFQAIAGSRNITANPLFASTKDFRLQAGSPAEDACDNSAWQGIPNIKDYDGVAITDERGNIVAPGGKVNCGAYE